MLKIKGFFSKKKEEVNFKLKLCGEGHTLSKQELQASSSRANAGNVFTPKRKELSKEVRAAAAAAIARAEKKTTEFNTSSASIKAQAMRELENEAQKSDQIILSETVSESNSNSNLVCQGVFFRCPVISEEILSKNEWRNKIKSFLYQQLEEERALTSCLIIHNCNIKAKAEECIKTLTKYLDNIIQFPQDEKYYRIRMSNRVFCERVQYVEGSFDFLHVAGFHETVIDSEKFLIWSRENVEQNYDLSSLLDILQNSEPIQLILDRNIKVLLPSQAKCVDLPPDFYRISPEEIKQEQVLRNAAIENNQILKTKAMREREEQRTVGMYKYALLRVKFPNGLFIQGTFSVYEKLRDIFEFVQSCLQDENLDFQLFMPGEIKFIEGDFNKTLYELRLFPNIVLFFNADNDTSHTDRDATYIKQDLLILVQSI